MCCSCEVYSASRCGITMQYLSTVIYCHIPPVVPRTFFYLQALSDLSEEWTSIDVLAWFWAWTIHIVFTWPNMTTMYSERKVPSHFSTDDLFFIYNAGSQKIIKDNSFNTISLELDKISFPSQNLGKSVFTNRAFWYNLMIDLSTAHILS